ncbi:hypothetical protein PYCCODRAFT_1274104 [Trametes coccinea BRFM310]|uniref:Uncharacterized protein n=1 Tax=Trametes coccinea (strain BRFM310) TaxID=1353009 RepID=A0A1Y2IV31_TRAC3|nr:hypothetical protein PYCCODRAFT_1274104 [Trametes coccinea BRFM310]
MRRQRQPSIVQCEVVPGPDELSCPRPAFGDRPRLCADHWKEYKCLTATYKALTEKAKQLYSEVFATDWENATLWTVENVNSALATARECLATLDEEIYSRREHHRRFFSQPDDRHASHEEWIRGLRKKHSEVSAIANQLRTCKAKLLDEERQRAEVLAERLRSYADVAVIGVDGSRHHRDSGSQLKSAYGSPRFPRQLCVARDHMGSRCESERMASQPRCQPHQIEHDIVLSALRAAESAARSLEGRVSQIDRHRHFQSAYTLQRAIDDIQTVSSYQETCRKIRALSADHDRLSGKDYTDSLPVAARLEVGAILNALYSIKSYWQEREANPPRQSQNERPHEESESEGGGGWVGSLLGMAAIGLSLWLGWPSIGRS